MTCRRMATAANRAAGRLIDCLALKAALALMGEHRAKTRFLIGDRLVRVAAESRHPAIDD